jgi:hypothetical protein
MNFLTRLFGKSASSAPEAILHKGCRIFPEPVREGGSYRIAARIEKDFDGVTKTHQLIRADTSAALDEATEQSVSKAKMAIDQLGDTLFR